MVIFQTYLIWHVQSILIWTTLDECNESNKELKEINTIQLHKAINNYANSR